MKKFCVGMAVHKDFEGAVQTIQAIRSALDLNDILHGTDHFRQTEFVVIGNSPGSEHDRHLEEFVSNIGGVFASCDIQGTSAPRNMIFEVSSAEYVLVMDCHLNLRADTVPRLWDWWEQHSTGKFLVSGPMLNDELVTYATGSRRWSIQATHMDDLWNDRMWGVWGRIWECPFGGVFSVLPDKDGNCQAIKLQMSKQATGHALSSVKLGHIPYRQGYESVLLEKGFSDWGQSDAGHYVDVPGMGLGLFSCRRDQWPGFPAECRGFGGEELNIHEKFRAAGGRVVCLDFLKWWHRFWRQGTPYSPKTAHTVANHFAWSRDRNDPWLLQNAHAHYVPRYLSQEDWDLVKDGKPVATAAIASLNTKYGRPQPENPSSLEDIFVWACSTNRDLNKHLPQLREMASKCRHVTEFSDRRESRIALAAGFPESLVSHCTEEDELHQTVQHAHSRTQLPSQFGRPRTAVWSNGESLKTEIDETDMLFIDTVHTGAHFLAELEKYHTKVRRWIVRHDTAIFGRIGADKNPGLAWAIKAFIEKHPEWFVASHTNEQHGLTVLGRQEQDRPAKPILLWPPGFGPGTEFKKIVESLNMNVPAGCGGCEAAIESLDRLGVEGLKEPARQRKLKVMKDGVLHEADRVVSAFDLAVEDIEGRAKGWGWDDPMKAAFEGAPEKPGLLASMFKAAKSGIAWELFKNGSWNPVEVQKRPIPHLLKLAMSRAEKAEAENPSCSPGKTCAKGECKGTCKTKP